MSLRRVLLDTDIASDVDDALALAALLGSPEVRVEGISTVYGDTVLRARVAARLLRVAGVPGGSVPVWPGEPVPLSGAEVWWAGHEGRLHPDLDAQTGVGRPGSGVDELVARVLAEPGELDVVAIGPLTNIATALRREPAFAGAVRHLWVMGGRFGEGADTADAEHNVRSDAVAAAEVVASGVPMTFTGLETTRRVLLGEDAIGRIGGAGVFGELLEREVRQWLAHWDETEDVPHDVTALLPLLRPDLVTTAEVAVRVVRYGEDAGVCVSDERGTPVRVVTDLDVPAATAEVLRRVLAGCAAR